MRKLVWIVAICLAVSLASCGGPPQPEPVKGGLAGELDGAPQWVLKGCSNFDSDPAPICGVGSVSGVRNLYMARSTATARALTDLRRNFRLIEQRSFTDYECYGNECWRVPPWAKRGTEYGTPGNEEQLASDAYKEASRAMLASATTVAVWESKTGVLWLMLAADVVQFKKAVADMTQLEAKTRDGILEMADKWAEWPSKE